MVAAYKANPNINAKNQAATIGHCEYFAAKFHELAAQSQELAQLHEQMAKTPDATSCLPGHAAGAGGQIDLRPLRLVTLNTRRGWPLKYHSID